MKIKAFFVLSLLLSGFAAHTCFAYNTSNEWQERRESLINYLPDNSAAFLFSTPAKVKSNDIEYNYFPDRNLFYFSGYTYQEGILVISKNQIDFNGVKGNTFLFIAKPDPTWMLWNGFMPDIAEIQKEFHLPNVLYMAQFKDFLNQSQIKNATWFTNASLTERSSKPFGKNWNTARAKDLFLNTQEEQKKAGSQKWFFETLGSIRAIKSDTEIQKIQQAVTITCMAQKNVAKSIKHATTEQQLHGIVQFSFYSEGAAGEAFPSIIGSGPRSCILHYTANNQELPKNRLLICDIGADWQGYAADVTRTYPIKGQFSEEEKTLYQIVLAAQKAGIDAAKAGVPFKEVYYSSAQIIAQGLYVLGIISKMEDYKLYFSHGTSHHLGLDVHDAAGAEEKLIAGNVITVEPGIYIKEGSNCDKKWWNIGIRIEDVVLITANANQVISACVPSSVEEIEQLMKEESDFKELLKR